MPLCFSAPEFQRRGPGGAARGPGGAVPTARSSLLIALGEAAQSCAREASQLHALLGQGNWSLGDGTHPQTAVLMELLHTEP